MYPAQKYDQAIFGSGCFWCSEAVFKRLKGVKSVESGYSGGDFLNPTYDDVSSGKTGHAEVIKIEYDPQKITYQLLLLVFFGTHDPTTLNRQGHDIGEQYRSLILYTNDQQKKQAKDVIDRLTKEKVFAKPIVTKLKKFETFYPAEDYHHDYYNRHKDEPYCLANINPKLKKMQKEFGQYIK